MIALAPAPALSAPDAPPPDSDSSSASQGKIVVALNSPQTDAIPTQAPVDIIDLSFPASPDDVSAAAQPSSAADTGAPAPASPAATGAASPASAANSSEASPSLIVDTSLGQADLWQRIRDGFALPELDSSLVEQHERWYADRPGYVARMMDRSQRYLYFITEEVEKRGMPTEIALLPMIESAFNPGAYSNGNASGIWQFIPSTGKNFGLRQNWWYDGRRDIVSATKSALDYLQKLHDQFGDWELALAAYNLGEGAVERAQEYNRRHGRPTDYASIRLPEETRNYVPKLIAVKNIIDAPEKFGLALPHIPNRPYFTTVSTAHHIDVKLAAKLADISVEEFNALNPANNRPVILEQNSDILLPVDKADTFRSNLESYTEPLVSWQGYKTKKGERLDKLAPRFGISLAKLRSVNGLSPHAKFSNGQELLVPLKGEEDDNEFEAFNTHLAPSYKLPSHSFTHIVKRGETINSISHHYHVGLGKLQSWNSNVTHLKPGQRLIIVAAKSHHSSGRKHIRQASARGKGKKRLAHRTLQHPFDVANR